MKRKKKKPKKRLNILVIGFFLIVVLVLLVLLNPFVPKNPIQKIIRMKEPQEVIFEATIIPIGPYVYVEDESWAVRTIFGDFDSSLGDRVKIIGGFRLWHDYAPFVDVLDVELLSRNFPIEPIQVSVINAWHKNRLVEIKNQGLQTANVRSLKEDVPFWVLDFGYLVVIPQEYVTSTIVEGNNYDIVGIVDCPPGDVCMMWSFEVSPS